MSGESATDFIRSLVAAWDCCATCAGGVLARRDAPLLDRLQAAEAAVDGLERRVADSGFDALDVFRSDRGSGEHERQGYLDGLRTAARIVRIALDGPQGDATGEVALGYADVLRVPERPPGWHEAETLCRGCAFCDSDHGGRRDGEGLA